ncbi:Threonine aspartase [Lachnellula subtilissima]|uniref:Threonine aspartase n=1 Tax=Lachnellula subtilissima TaxID=602034 RepID=A0A8H8UCA7_9HELO|nr:Threonine aspartase [Lachnellula subtilissima]
MQNQNLQPRHFQIHNTISTTRERLRQFRRDLSHHFRKSSSQACEIETAPPIRAESDSPRHSSSKLQVLDPEPIPPSPGSSAANTASSIKAMDGAAERLLRQNNPQFRPQTSAVFVHAGAGYHSTTNEHIHLGACDNAARLAMQVLRGGGSAVDAVEAAIKVLEDKEITNAGFGSNLSIEGIVECDATIVDHMGRSGACGATAQIKNPIHLARIILDASSKPLSLRRVPPNLLVSQGATDFAYEHGIPVVPHDAIVSKNARDRYVRWRDDLRRADRGRMTPSTGSDPGGDTESIDHKYEERVRSQQRRDHTNALLHGTWNEGQPDSPQLSPSIEKRQTDVTDQYPSRRSPVPAPSIGDPSSQSNLHQRSRSPNSSPPKRVRYTTDSQLRTRSLLGPSNSTTDLRTIPDVRMTTGDAVTTTHQSKPEYSDGTLSPTHEAIDKLLWSERPAESLPEPLQRATPKDDMITDTVGAIAIDMYGNIAAGSSSGGIGMKHRGRVGPAALVGIGTAVIPVDEKDQEGISVAAVTSGTGEHMATTIASQKCAERLYHNTRRARGGKDIDATEEEAMESFVQADFMSHPGVSASNSAGAIGVMAVKKTPYGYFLHFAHNTDSFALASMHSNEKEPKCVMSRLGEHGTTVQGGRKIRA